MEAMEILNNQLVVKDKQLEEQNKIIGHLRNELSAKNNTIAKLQEGQYGQTMKEHSVMLDRIKLIVRTVTENIKKELKEIKEAVVFDVNNPEDYSMLSTVNINNSVKGIEKRYSKVIEKGLDHFHNIDINKELYAGIKDNNIYTTKCNITIKDVLAYTLDSSERSHARALQIIEKIDRGDIPKIAKTVTSMKKEVTSMSTKLWGIDRDMENERKNHEIEIGHIRYMAN